MAFYKRYRRRSAVSDSEVLGVLKRGIFRDGKATSLPVTDESNAVDETPGPHGAV